jgi:hypothetical protein
VFLLVLDDALSENLASKMTIALVRFDCFSATDCKGIDLGWGVSGVELSAKTGCAMRRVDKHKTGIAAKMKGWGMNNSFISLNVKFIRPSAKGNFAQGYIPIPTQNTGF